LFFIWLLKQSVLILIQKDHAMKNKQPTNWKNEFLRRNWWKLTVLLVLLYIVFQKDLSFQVNLSNPYGPNQRATPPASGIVGEQEKMTDQGQPQPVSSSNPSLRDLFELPALFGQKNESKPLFAQLNAIGEDRRVSYLKRFARVAISERKKYQIPSSIILGSALLQSTAGTRSMTVTGNNHFGLRCGEHWNGQSGLYQGQCFRHYENAWASFRDHSELMANQFPELLKLGSDDYQAWAHALEQKGWSTEPGFANRLVELIERYQLDELDKK
jgi:flagellum-specific peptidoglycan hydrolase FlgJ